MTKMETNDLKSYQMRLQCKKCGKFIDVDFFIKLNERNQYGKKEIYWPKNLPEYLVMGLGHMHGHILDHSSQKHTPPTTYGINPWGTSIVQQPMQPIHQLEPFIVCQQCKDLEKLKE